MALTLADRAAIFERDKGLSGICGSSVTWDDLDVDHILPLSAGGSDDYVNLRAAHVRCNRSRRNDGQPVIYRGLPRINIEVYPDDEELVREAKVAALRQGRTLREWFMDAIRRELERQPGASDAS